MIKKILLVFALFMAIGLVLSVLNIIPLDPWGPIVTPVSPGEPTEVTMTPGPVAPTTTAAPTLGKEPKPTLTVTPISHQGPADPTKPPSPTAILPNPQPGRRLFVPQISQQELLFQVQPGTPAYLKNFVHSDRGCNWLSVAGQVIETGDSAPNGKPLPNLVVGVLGLLDGNVINQMTLTGLAADYGPGGYEIQLADKPLASTQALWVQVFDLMGQPITKPVFFDTKAECSQNVVLINFKR
jgi:hypothetical protein